MTPGEVDARLRARLSPASGGWSPTELPLAAVLCPLVERGGVDHVLFVARPHELRSHAGQIAFPGGKRDGDEEPVATALRECREEIGAPESAVSLLGRLPPRTSSSGLSVHCLVGRLADVPLQPAPGEVARVLYVPLADLRDDARWEERQPPRQASGRLPPISPHFEFGGELLWGLTARFVRDLAAALR